LSKPIKDKFFLFPFFSSLLNNNNFLVILNLLLLTLFRLCDSLALCGITITNPPSSLPPTNVVTPFPTFPPTFQPPVFGPSPEPSPSNGQSFVSDYSTDSSPLHYHSLGMIFLLS
jgi:hypothetical protein